MNAVTERRSATATKPEHIITKLLGIKLQEPELIREDFPGSPDEVFYERQPSTTEVLQGLLPTGRDVLHYLTSLFPFLSWLGHYNLQWLLGDVVAGEIWPKTRPQAASS
jgi:solute carrier family 26 (sodium-independent sulfate anion transporter), member 11